MTRPLPTGGTLVAVDIRTAPPTAHEVRSDRSKYTRCKARAGSMSLTRADLAVTFDHVVWCDAGCWPAPEAGEPR